MSTSTEHVNPSKLAETILKEVKRVCSLNDAFINFCIQHRGFITLWYNFSKKNFTIQLGILLFTLSIFMNKKSVFYK